MRPMTENDAKRPEEEDDEDDWMKYATASFGETDYSLWDEVEPVEEEDEAYQQEVAMQLGTHVEEIPGHRRPLATSTWYEKEPATLVWVAWAASACTANRWRNPVRQYEPPSWSGTSTWPTPVKRSRFARFAKTCLKRWTCWRTSFLIPSNLTS